MVIKSRIIVLMVYVFGPIYGGCFRIIPPGVLVSSKNSCTLPPAGGMCFLSMRRYFFNSSSGRCETFTYKGCGGNENNFLTEQLCKNACGESEDGVDDEKQSNSLLSISLNIPSISLEQPDACDYPKKVGLCKASKRRYYFNGESCKMFIYGGCGKNPNNFKTKADCMKKCEHKLDIGSGEAEDDDLLLVEYDTGKSLLETTVNPPWLEVDDQDMLPISIFD